MDVLARPSERLQNELYDFDLNVRSNVWESKLRFFLKDEEHIRVIYILYDSVMFNTRDTNILFSNTCMKSIQPSI